MSNPVSGGLRGVGGVLILRVAPPPRLRPRQVPAQTGGRLYGSNYESSRAFESCGAIGRSCLSWYIELTGSVELFPVSLNAFLRTLEFEKMREKWGQIGRLRRRGDTFESNFGQWVGSTGPWHLPCQVDPWTPRWNPDERLAQNPRLSRN